MHMHHLLVKLLLEFADIDTAKKSALSVHHKKVVCRKVASFDIIVVSLNLPLVLQKRCQVLSW